MAEKIKYEVLTTEDGELWGIVTYQPVSLIEVTPEALLDALQDQAENLGLDPDEFNIDFILGFSIQKMAFKQGDGEDDCTHEGCDCSFYWCEPDHPAAIHVTGIKCL